MDTPPVSRRAIRQEAVVFSQGVRRAFRRPVAEERPLLAFLVYLLHEF